LRAQPRRADREPLLDLVVDLALERHADRFGRVVEQAELLQLQQHRRHTPAPTTPKPLLAVSELSRPSARFDSLIPKGAMANNTILLCYFRYLGTWQSALPKPASTLGSSPKTGFAGKRCNRIFIRLG
jgi:hypothetical protein